MPHNSAGNGDDFVTGVADRDTPVNFLVIKEELLVKKTDIFENATLYEQRSTRSRVDRHRWYCTHGRNRVPCVQASYGGRAVIYSGPESPNACSIERVGN
jgi:hypothetical protein